MDWTTPVSKIEIALCTWNRSKSLSVTLASLEELSVPTNCQLGIVIVNNNSTDNTAKVIRAFERTRFASRHAVKVLHEPRQGHTYARNKAVENLQCDLTIWTDDDVIVDPDLVQAYLQYANQYPKVAFFGGKILPKFNSTPPGWVNKNWELLKGCFAQRDLGDDPVAFSSSCLPYGANFAVRTSVQTQFKFDVGLGRRGEEVHGEDELEMMRRLLAAGLTGQWVPDAKVQHLIPADRVNEKYIRDYFVGQGKALVANGKPWTQKRGKLRRQARLDYWRYRLCRTFTPSKSSTWIPRLVSSGLAQGQFEALNALTASATETG